MKYSEQLKAIQLEKAEIDRKIRFLNSINPYQKKK
jgi:hypothetical protein